MEIELKEEGNKEESFKFNSTTTGKVNWELKLVSNEINEEFWKRVDTNLKQAKIREDEYLKRG
jgi:hypothetical protein